MNGAQQTFLDIARTIAAQAVLFGHAWTTLIGPLPLMPGNFGVAVFFVLSGFLITWSILDKRTRRSDYGFGEYFADRFFRIFVPFVPALLLVTAVDPLTWLGNPDYEHRPEYSLLNFIGNLLMLQQNPVGLFADQLLHMEALKIATFGSARPFWTVAIEWWLYLFFGWMVFRHSLLAERPVLFVTVLLLFSIVPLFNVVAGTGEGLTLIWFLSAGVAWVLFRFPEAPESFLRVIGGRPAAWWLLAVLLGMMLVRMVWVSWVLEEFEWVAFHFYDVTFNILMVGFFVVCMVVLAGRVGARRSGAAMFFSDYSYSLYLIHYTLIMCLDAWDVRVGPPLVSLLAYVVICNVCSIAFWWAFERNHGRVKSWWRGRGQARGVTAR